MKKKDLRIFILTTEQTTHDLTQYDLIVVSSSAGKDSLAMLDYIVELAKEQGVSLDKIVVVHADLGRVEWDGTAELAERQAKKYGLRFIKKSRPQGDLLTQIEQRGMFPDKQNRYCTSDHKRGQINTIVTSLHRELADQVGLSSRKHSIKVLDCQGLRATESKDRAKHLELDGHCEYNEMRSCGTREVTTWYPILTWTTEQVWERIKSRGLEYHKAYDLGMPRLSCVFCIFAPKAALLIAGKHNPELLNEYVRVEEKIGHTFRNGFKIAEIKAELEKNPEAPVELSAEEAESWSM